jgi:hypothetical protein
MSKKKKIEFAEHELAVIIFIDPAYSPGWTNREDIPSKKEMIHVGTGVVIQEDDESVTIAVMVGLFDEDKTECTLNPFRIHKDLIIMYDKFTWEDYYDKIRKSRTRWIKKVIDLCISKFT